MEININNVEFRDDLYPRFEPEQSLIQKYADSIEHLPAIEVNQDNILIDGYHRWKAHQLVEKEKIKAKTTKTESEKELKKLAYQRNSHHGKQLESNEKKEYAQEMIGQMEVKSLAKLLGVGKTTIKRWTKSQRKAQKQQRNRKITNLYLKAWNSQESIADILGVSKKTISNVINSCKKAQMDDFTQNFEPYLYNIWKQKNQDNNNEDHFGSFPLTYMKNLLYYHTEPLDIIFDPFAGGGTTVDTCKEMFRRYYCTDRKVRAGREKEIKKHDIKEGLPDNLPKPDLTFLDPPYWKQAEGKYSNSEDDLGNMKLNEFYESIQKLFNQLVDRGSKKIALVIQPTQYANDFNFEDHVMKFNQMLSNKYEIEMRYILPYSTQQYNAQMVEKAKEKKECLALHRDLIIWSRDIDD
jgi:DNA modification methylase